MENKQLAQAFIDRDRLQKRYDELAREMQRVLAELREVEALGKSLSLYWNTDIGYVGFGFEEKLVKQLKKAGVHTVAQAAMCTNKPKGVNWDNWYAVQEVLRYHGIPTDVYSFRQYWTPGEDEQS